MTLKSPYPYFGGKSKVAAEIWQRFGNAANYIEPFFGSGAVLLARPHDPELELVNDLDGYIVNFWRAVQADADAVAEYADYPAFESDLHARHVWLVRRKDDLQAKLEGDPNYYDAKIAGWWVWGMSLWIGSGFCSGRGSWGVVGDKLVNMSATGAGIARQSPRLSAWQGVNSAAVARQLLRYGDRSAVGVKRNLIERTRPHLSARQGVRCKLPETVSARGVTARRDGLLTYMRELQARFRRVRVTCGDWSRVVTPAVLNAKTPTAVLIDPPYTGDGREADLYNADDAILYQRVRQWALDNGSNPDLRIAYCGYDDGFDYPDGWTALRWKANGGYANQGNARKGNAEREVIWFSPSCMRPEAQLSLFSEVEA